MHSIIKKTYISFKRRIAQDANFWILFSFLPSFVIARLLVYNFPELFLNIRGTHIHHFTYGIVLLACSGFWAQNTKDHKWKRIIAIIYGIGLGLSFDEFGMWLHLKDNYWVRQSYDAIIIVTAILINVVYFSTFWQKLFHFHKREMKGALLSTLNSDTEPSIDNEKV